VPFQRRTAWSSGDFRGQYAARKPTAYRNRTPGKRVSDLEPDELLYTDDPAADRQAVRPVADLGPV
jgi:hypothetical protein